MKTRSNYNRFMLGSKSFENFCLVTIQKMLLSSTFLWCCLLCCTRWFKVLSLWIKSYSVTIQGKATEQYFSVVLFIMLYKVVLIFESVDEGILTFES